MVSGVSLDAYWVSSFLWDLSSLVLPVGFTLTVLVTFDVDGLISGKAAGATMLLFLFYGLSMVRKDLDPYRSLATVACLVECTAIAMMRLRSIQVQHIPNDPCLTLNDLCSISVCHSSFIVASDSMALCQYLFSLES